MPRDSNGNASTDPVYIATPGTTIRAVQHNTPISDIIQMLTGSLARNGTGGMLADLAMGGFKITGLADGILAQDAITKAQLDAATSALPSLGAWTNVASASTVDLGAQASRNLVITGTTTITSFGTAGASDNVPYRLRFSGVLTLTNGANLILPGGENITTAAGDIAVVVHDDADTWRVEDYSSASVSPGFASQAKAEAGTDTAQAMNAARTLDAINYRQPGNNMTVKDFTSSRLLNTVYQNPYDVQIEVAVRFNASSTSNLISYKDYTNASTQWGYTSTGPGGNMYLQISVPPKGFYKFTADGGGTFSWWREQRP